MMFQILYMGIGYLHEADFLIERQNGYPHYLALLIRSQCRLKQDGEIRPFPPNTFILYDVNAPHFYAANGEAYIDDWVQFTCDPDVMKQFELPYNQPITLPDAVQPAQYFKLICDAYFRGFNDNAVINALMTAMFSDFSISNQSTSQYLPYYDKLMALREEICAVPQRNWNIPEMAERLHISTSRFQRLYRDAFGIPVMKDVIINRIEAAKTMLQCTNLTAEEIALRCGYNSPVHFSRQFKKMTGFSPVNWHKQSKA